MTTAYNTITIGEVIIETAKPTMRLRDQARKVVAKLKNADAADDTKVDFALIVAYTTGVIGLGWEPPTHTASETELTEALSYWLDNIDTDISDKWIKGIFPTKPKA